MNLTVDNEKPTRTISSNSKPDLKTDSKSKGLELKKSKHAKGVCRYSVLFCIALVLIQSICTKPSDCCSLCENVSQIFELHGSN